ncbi:MAG: tetratricopeptide repeat protein [Armatimonadota bacterium]|nr:hypothetical protein [bacterium]
MVSLAYMDDIRSKAEFDKLITAAHVHRRRGDYAEADRAIRHALDMCPNDMDAREFAADMLFARGRLEQAAKEYKAILSEDASRTYAEEQYARVILQISEGKRQQELLKDMLENPSKYRAPARSPLVAAILSIAPGFGQIYNGQFVKGAALFTTTMILWFFFYLMRPDVSAYRPDVRMMQFVQNLSPLAVIFALSAFFLQVYAFVDAPVVADKQKKNQDAQPG